jgi:hypothetical protein
MSPKQVTLAVGAVLFTAINLLVLAANWSISAHAKVAGMDFSRLEVDTDFRRAVRGGRGRDGPILLAAEYRFSRRGRGCSRGLSSSF